MIQTKLEPNPLIIDKSDIGVIVFRCENFDTPILEKPTIDWVADAVAKYSINIVDYNTELSEIEQIKSNLPDTKLTIVLYSFNPLLTSQNIDLCVDYLALKDEKLIKLTYGYIFDTEYFKSISTIKEPAIFTGDGSEFLKISTVEDFGYAAEVLQRRIIRKFIDDGVCFINPSNVVVGAYVEIATDATIYPFNTLCGDTKIATGVTLKENNTISNTIIGEDTIVANSVLCDSVIGAHTVIFPYNTIENNCDIGNYCTIKSYNKISNAKIEDNTEIESFNEIG